MPSYSTRPATGGGSGGALPDALALLAEALDESGNVPQARVQDRAVAGGFAMLGDDGILPVEVVPPAPPMETELPFLLAQFSDALDADAGIAPSWVLERDVADGFAMLDGAGKLAVARIPELTDVQIGAAAAIAGTKIAPNFGGQAVTTTGAATVASLTVSSLGAGIGHYSAGGAVSSSPIVNADVAAAAAIAGSKIAPNFGAQAVTTTGAATVASLTVSSLGAGIGHYSAGGAVSSSPIVNADVDAAAAIAGSKIAPNFGAQAVTTTGAATVASLTVSSLGAGIGHYSAGGAVSSSPIVNADVDAAAAIAGSKIAPDFGAQTVMTSGYFTAAASANLPTTGNYRSPYNTTALTYRNSTLTADVVAVLQSSGGLQFGDGSQSPNTLLRGQSTVAAQIGTTTIFEVRSTYVEIVAPSLRFNIFTASPIIGQAPRGTDAVTYPLRIQGQAPWASASGTNRNPGNIILDVQAPASGGAAGKVQVLVSGNAAAEIDNVATDGETALLLRRNVGGVYSLKRVSMGAVDSGGTGFKVLRVEN